jgi:drug/metabolite transporter (DMT)-like permease
MKSPAHTLPAVANASASSALTPTVLYCLLATWIVWGSTYLAIKFALLSFPPFIAMGSRFIVAGVILLIWMKCVRRAALPTARQWRNSVIVGGLMLGGGMGGTAYSEQTVGSGLVVAFIAVVPVMMVLGNRLWGISPSKGEMAGVAISLVGVLMLVQGAGFSASPEGLIAIVLGCIAWTIGSLLSLRVPSLACAPGAMGFGSQMLSGGALMMAAAFALGEHREMMRLWPPQPVAIAAWWYLVIFGSLIAFVAYMVLLEKTSAVLASSYCFVNPVLAMLLGVAVAGEVISGFEWVSAVIVSAGVVLVLRSRR